MVFFNRLAGRLVCWFIGFHTADWTLAHMCGGEPICRICRRPKADW